MALPQVQAFSSHLLSSKSRLCLHTAGNVFLFDSVPFAKVFRDDVRSDLLALKGTLTSKKFCCLIKHQIQELVISLQ